LAYGDRGVPGVIPPRAMLIAEITILDAAAAAGSWT
jgi:FKBP-type peptidyl-prolyl cis-trans isomerase